MGGCPSVSECVSVCVCVCVCVCVTPKNDLLNNNRILQTALNGLRAKTCLIALRVVCKNILLW